MIDDPFSLQRGISQKALTLLYCYMHIHICVCTRTHTEAGHTKNVSPSPQKAPWEQNAHPFYLQGNTNTIKWNLGVSKHPCTHVNDVCVCPPRGPASTGSLWHGACNGLGFDRNELLRRMVGHVYGNRSNEVHVWTRFGGLFSMETSNIVLVEPYHNGQGCAWWCPVLPKPAQRYG